MMPTQGEEKWLWLLHQFVQISITCSSIHHHATAMVVGGVGVALVNVPQTLGNCRVNSCVLLAKSQCSCYNTCTVLLPFAE